MKGFAYIALGCMGAVIVIATLENWRNGVYFFLIWLLFEDFARKMLGNNMAIFFAKDVLLVALYISFVTAFYRKTVEKIRPPFLVPLLVFVWFGIGQVFNPASTTLLFGVLGVKLFFSYIPLFFIGYALLNSEVDVRRFLKVNVMLALVIGSLGIAQSILGPSFLSPAKMPDELRGAGDLYRVSAGGLIAYRPTSVFVSTGRYSNYMLVAWLLLLGYSGYLLLRHRGGRNLAFIGLAVVAAGVLLGTSRGLFMWALGSLILSAVAFIWARPQHQEAIRIIRVMQRALVAIVLAIVALTLIYPEALASRLAIYSETLTPGSAHSELQMRTWDYPWRNFMMAFNYDRWPYGYGIGTDSLGVQYISAIFHEAPVGIGVESGFGQIVLEMGIGGLALWLLMSGAILVSALKVLKKLKGSPWFPIGFVILLYAFLLLLPMTFGNIGSYQDFVMNAYLWLLLGILFRLPQLPFAPNFAPTGPRPQLGTRAA